MPIEQRRQAILEAVGREVVDREMDLTTRELAQLAGVAEGTLFRVFGSKEELLVAAFSHRLEQVARDESWRDELALPSGGDGGEGAGLDARLTRYIDVITGRIADWTHLMSVLHRFLRGTEAVRERDLREANGPEMRRIRGLYGDTLHAFASSCRDLLDPYRDGLRVDIDRAVAFVQSISTAMALSRRFHDFGLTPSAAADIVLHGVLGDASVTPDTSHTASRKEDGTGCSAS